jgi:uncharacterized protein (TIGR02265 family)
MADAGFVSPDWDAPLDTEERVAQVPEVRTVKGMLFKSLVDAAVAGSGQLPEGAHQCLAFKDYPLRELVELIPRAAVLAYPETNERRAVRELGRRAYHAIRGSSVGKVVFAFGGREFEGGLNLVSRIYSLITRFSVKVVQSKRGEAVLELRGMWAYPDCYHVGVFEAALDDYGKNGRVRVRRHTLCDVDLKLEWTD